MSYETVLVSKENGYAIITLNRPEVHNALSNKLNQDIKAAVMEMANDKDVRVLIITGAGDKAFCAGMDLKEYSESKLTPIEDWERRMERGATGYLLRLPKPVIAAINGFAIAGGLELALSCDIRIASDRATFGLFEIRRGFFAGSGATWRLPPLVGRGWAMELALVGEPINAEVAERIGLVNHVVPHGKLMDTAREMAAKIASRSPQAVVLCKAAIDQSLDIQERAGFNISMALRSLAETNEDRKEATKAFVDKKAR